MRISRIVLGLALGLAVIGCSTTGKGLIYFEPSVDRKSLDIQRVAVVPNRLPLNLTDPDYWRKHNWEIVRREFSANQFEVVDYETSVATFGASGLPVEDTKSSRDKYAELAEQLGVDVVVVPYYGTFSDYKNVLMLFNHVSYHAVATFQIYLVRDNEFYTRIDVNGCDRYTTGILSALGFPLTFAEPMAGVIAMGAGALVDMVQSFVPARRRWGRAFNVAISEGLKPFWASVSLPTAQVRASGGTVPASAPVVQPPTPVDSPPPSSSAALGVRAAGPLVGKPQEYNTVISVRGVGQPVSAVLVDGVLVERTTPCEIKGAKPGWHKLTVLGGTFEGRERVFVDHGGRTTVAVGMSRVRPAMLPVVVVRGVPEGASITVDGAPISSLPKASYVKSPNSCRASVGEVEIVVRHPDFQDLATRVILLPGEMKTVECRMSPRE